MNSVVFLRDCDRDNTFLHVHVDLEQVAARNPATSPAQVCALLRDGFERLATQLHLTVFAPRVMIKGLCPLMARASPDASAVLFAGAPLQVTQTIEVWSRNLSPTDIGVLGVRLHWSHPQEHENPTAAVAVEANEARRQQPKRARFVRLFNAAWIKLLRAYGLIDTLTPSAASTQRAHEQRGLSPQSRKRVRLPEDNEDSCCGSCSSSSSGGDSDSESDCDSDDGSSWGLPLQPRSLSSSVPPEPLRSAMRSTNNSSAMRRSVRFSEGNVSVAVPMTVVDREARMALGETATFGRGFSKPLRSTRTGEMLWQQSNRDERCYDQVCERFGRTRIGGGGMCKRPCMAE